VHKGKEEEGHVGEKRRALLYTIFRTRGVLDWFIELASDDKGMPL